MVGSGWSIAEGDDYERGVAQCGGAPLVDEAISPVVYALSRNPLGFGETEVTGVWLARTKLRVNGPDITLSHSVWFTVDELNRSVTLLWVEMTRPDDMQWEDDFDPFK